MRHWYLCIVLIILWGCNPFAPAYDAEGLGDRNLLGDPTTVDGYFQLFKNSYELRDTTLYGRLFAKDFVFTYYDFEQGQEISWDRATEMNISFNLFRSVRLIILDWNYYIQLDTSLVSEALVIRSFNLYIEQDDELAFNGTGRARFRLERDEPGDPWKAVSWFDDSDF